MQLPLGMQDDDIKAELVNCKLAFARRIGRRLGQQIANGCIDPKLAVRCHFKELAVSRARLLTLYEIHGVAPEYAYAALQATITRVRRIGEWA